MKYIQTLLLISLLCLCGFQSATTGYLNSIGDWLEKRGEIAYYLLGGFTGGCSDLEQGSALYRACIAADVGYSVGHLVAYRKLSQMLAPKLGSSWVSHAALFPVMAIAAHDMRKYIFRPVWRRIRGQNKSSEIVANTKTP